MGSAIRELCPLRCHPSGNFFTLIVFLGSLWCVLNKRFHAPVLKRNTNPVYPAKDATFDFLIYLLLADRLGIWFSQLSGSFVLEVHDTVELPSSAISTRYVANSFSIPSSNTTHRP